MKYVIAILLFLMPLSATSSDSGLYFDSTRSGEGIGLHRNGDRITFFLYTFGEHGCEHLLAPVVGPVIPQKYDCEYQGQRWLMGSGNLENDQEVDGFLYATFGTNYPEGVVQPGNPWAVDVGEPIAIGFFTLRRWHDGWQLLVAPYGFFLPPDDPLFSRVFNFDTPLFFSED